MLSKYFQNFSIAIFHETQMEDVKQMTVRHIVYIVAHISTSEFICLQVVFIKPLCITIIYFWYGINVHMHFI